MRFSTALFGLAAFTAVNAASPSDWTIQVAVGPDGLLKYSPNNIVAPVGSKIQFLFNPKNHTVTQSSFSDPCHPLAGGFFSGFVPTTQSPAPTTFTIDVKDTKPIWFYCGQTTGNHCQKGMVGAVNAPTTGNTLDAFVALAAKASNSTSPDVTPGTGGVLATSNSTLSAATTLTTAEATAYALSTYTTSGQAVATTVSTQVVFETVLISATPVSAAPSSSSGGATSATSATSTGGAPEKTAHLLGAAVLGLGALALL